MSSWINDILTVNVCPRHWRLTIYFSSKLDKWKTSVSLLRQTPCARTAIFSDGKTPLQTGSALLLLGRPPLLLIQATPSLPPFPPCAAVLFECSSKMRWIRHANALARLLVRLRCCNLIAFRLMWADHYGQLLLMSSSTWAQFWSEKLLGPPCPHMQKPSYQPFISDGVMEWVSQAGGHFHCEMNNTTGAERNGFREAQSWKLDLAILSQKHRRSSSRLCELVCNNLALTAVSLRTVLADVTNGSAPPQIKF